MSDVRGADRLLRKPFAFPPLLSLMESLLKPAAVG